METDFGRKENGEGIRIGDTDWARKICFINFKGGVGKTTLAVNFAATLAKRGHKILLVDLDPQSNASLWLLGETRFDARLQEPQKTVYQLFLDRIPHVSGGHSHFRFNDAVIKAVARKEDHCITPHLDLLPNTYEAIQLEPHLDACQAPKHDILKRQLENIESEYEYIIFDCAPNLYLTNINALLFTNYYIIPVYPDYFAKAGLLTLTRQIKKRLDQYQGYVRDMPNLLGVVIARIKTGATFDMVRKTDLEGVLNDLKSEDIISPDARVFETHFNDTVDVARSVDEFVPSIYYQPSHDTMRRYIGNMNNFTDEVLDKI